LIVIKVQKHPKQKKVSAPQAIIPAILIVPAIELQDGCVSQDQIRECAFQIYESRGNEPGEEMQDWLHAERQIRGR
jgi:Protein of unknown function (DUF2934)